MLFTDPPYGINIVKNQKVGGDNWVSSSHYKEIKNDNDTNACKKLFFLIDEYVDNKIIWGGNYFTNFLEPSSCWIIWNKKNTGNFADVEMAWVDMEKGAKLYEWLWNGLSRQGDRKTELSKRVHPTQKPVGLFVDIFNDFKFNSCIDTFLGSGSTLIACEKTNRKCYGMELDTYYCDVIINRWEQFTGKKAELLNG